MATVPHPPRPLYIATVHRATAHELPRQWPPAAGFLTLYSLPGGVCAAMLPVVTYTPVHLYALPAAGRMQVYEAVHGRAGVWLEAGCDVAARLSAVCAGKYEVTCSYGGVFVKSAGDGSVRENDVMLRTRSGCSYGGAGRRAAGVE